MRLIEQAGTTYSVSGASGLKEKFLATKNLILSGFKKLDIIRNKVLKRFRWLSASLVYH